MKTEYKISGMTCHACDELISEEVATIPGVTKATANHKTGKLVVESAASLSKSDVSAKVKAAGAQYALL